MATSKFHHEEIFRGKDLVNRLADRMIVVCGVGAVGSNLIDGLSRQGFSSLRAIDFDRVETHNIGNQAYAEADVGALKAEALRNRTFRNVGVEIESHTQRLEAGNAKKLLKGAHLVVDAFDNSASRSLVQDECRARKTPCLHVGLFEDYAEVMWDQAYKVPQDVEGDVCDYPLARNLVVLATVVAAEEILDFCLAKKPRQANWTVTLKDLAVRRMK